MNFRRSGSRDERRRRVLMEEATAELPADDASPPKRTRTRSDEGPSARYAPGVLADGQPRITSLLPKRRLTLWLWVGAAATIVAALATLHVQSRAWSRQLPQVDFLALDATAHGGLANWFSTLVLAWAGFAAVQVYLIRRHRNDDYRGGYRLWLWLAGLLLAASAAVATSLDQMAVELAVALCGIPLNGRFLHGALVATVAAVGAVRMIWEIKPSRGALLVLAAASAAYLTASAGNLRLFALPEPWSTVRGAVSTMAGHVFVLLTIAVFGRFVHLEARGELAQKPAKDKSKPVREKGGRKSSGKAGESAPGDEARPAAKKRVARTDLNEAAAKEAKSPPADSRAEAKPAAATDKIADGKRDAAVAKESSDKKSTLAASSSVKAAAKLARETAPDDDDLDDDDADAPGQLSKAERRRLRKQKKQNSRAA